MVEILFGLWLVLGLSRHTNRLLCLALFTSMSAVALAQAVGGAPSCACFGDISVTPWITFAFDLIVIGLLWRWQPQANGSKGRRLIIFCGIILVVGCLLKLAPQDKKMVAEIDMGSVAVGSTNRRPFAIKNDARGHFYVASIKTSCPCVVISLDRVEVNSQQLLTGTVILDLTSKQNFVGSLAIEATGFNESGDKVFIMMIGAQVTPNASGSANH